MTSEAMPEKSPNEALAELVTAKLKEKGFVANGKTDEITARLAAGTANRDDWRLWVELAQTKPQKDESDGSN